MISLEPFLGVLCFSLVFHSLRHWLRDRPSSNAVCPTSEKGGGGAERSGG